MITIYVIVGLLLFIAAMSLITCVLLLIAVSQPIRKPPIKVTSDISNPEYHNQLIHPVTRWLLKRITKKLVLQSPHHQKRIIAYYQIMRDAAKSEFSEDNEPTLNAFLLDCWHAAHKPTKENQ
jgi:hypothetical protein